MRLPSWFLMFLVGVCFFGGALVASAQLSANGNVAGWMWGATTDESLFAASPPIPWPESPPNSTPLDNPAFSTGVGWISLNGPSYGITIPLAGDGPVIGHAWSSNLGWLDFQPAGPYPAAPNHAVAREGLALTGWARFMAFENIPDNAFNNAPVSIGPANAPNNYGGYDGWVKFSGVTTGGQTYGVAADLANPGLVNGFVYSGDFGWIHFAGNVAAVSLTPTCSLTAAPNVGQAPPAFPVTLNWTTTNNPESCVAAGDWTGSKAVSGGSEVLGPVGSTRNYSLLCTRTISGNVVGLPCATTVTVTPPPPADTPPTCSINISSQSGPAPLSGAVTWSAQGNPTPACVASGNGWSIAGTKPITGSEAYGPFTSGTHTFSLTCTNSFGTDTCGPVSSTVTNTLPVPIPPGCPLPPACSTNPVCPTNPGCPNVREDIPQ